MIWVVIFILAATVLFLAKIYLAARKQLRKYKPIIKLDEELAQRTSARDSALKQLRETETLLSKLAEEVKILTDDSDLLSAGFYKPRYAFGDSKKFAERLDSIRDQQKALIKAKSAIVCGTEWTVGGSKAEGKKMTDRVVKLGLSAFNVQCDNEILSVRFDNIDRSEAKLTKIRENVDKLLEPNQCRITNEFFKLKVEELYLAYEYQEQLHKEKEEQRALREQMKEEERARREAERAQNEAEREESRYADALEKARKELERKTEGEREEYSAKIAQLEAQLREAQEKRERAKSMAEQTRRGHVYIISNIGSFGENVYKIGMTRRLDPMDRIWELGDASVPFDFDVHALVQSEDAPALERKLHETFGERRVNRINARKEFFRARIEEIAEACKRFHGHEFRLTLFAEAKEYRQTIAMTQSKESEAA